MWLHKVVICSLGLCVYRKSVIVSLQFAVNIPSFKHRIDLIRLKCNATWYFSFYPEDKITVSATFPHSYILFWKDTRLLSLARFPQIARKGTIKCLKLRKLEKRTRRDWEEREKFPLSRDSNPRSFAVRSLLNPVIVIQLKRLIA